MKSITSFLLLVVAFIGNGQDFCKKGEAFYNEGNYHLAIQSLSNCLEINSENEEAQYGLGRSYAELEKWEQAVDVFQKLVEANPENADYNFLYGGSLGLYAKSLNPIKSIGYISDIKLYLKKAIELDKEHIDARWALVQIYMELPFMVGGSKSTAKSYAQELLELSPIDGHLALGYIAVYQKDWGEAEKHYKNAVRVGQSETAFTKLVEVLIEQNKMQEAEKTLKEAYRVTRVIHFKELLQKIQST